MLATTDGLVRSSRLEAMIRHCVGWQIDDLDVRVGEFGVTLSGHARTALARVLAEQEAERLTGLPVVECHIAVS